MLFKYQNKEYPNLVKEGFHAQYAFPIAKKFCSGMGIDIGCNKKEWAFPGWVDLCDLTLDAPWNNAFKIPVKDSTYDFVFSSHCLEHLTDYITALQEWTRILKPNGILFLYLPSSECDYWRPVNNKKHCHIFRAEDLKYDLQQLGYKNVITSSVDLAYSFMVIGIKND
jgi:SAM-dependent methyltransferase